MSGGLLQIHDPLKTQGRAVGIDLGTTNSLVAWVKPDGKPECLSVDEGGSRLLPSVVYYWDDPSCAGVVVGQQARREAASHPHDVIASAKRFMGKVRAMWRREGWARTALPRRPPRGPCRLKGPRSSVFWPGVAK